MRISTRFAQRSARPSFLDAFVVLLLFEVTLAFSRPAAADAPPTVPTNPRPLNGSTSQSIVSTLRWECIDFDNDMAAYDIYLGVDPAPPLAATNLTYKYYQPAAPLDPLTTYFWRVVARDFAGHETSSPTWSFTTGPENVPPDAPSTPSPADGSTGSSTQADLAWSCSDIDGDSLTYSVYFGTDALPPLVAAGVAPTSFSLDALELGTTYHWRIVALDARGAETSGPVWSLTTRAQNQPPVVPYSEIPYSGAAGVALNLRTVSWRASDPEADSLTYDVYLGTDPSPPLVGSNFPPGYPGDRTYYPTGNLVGLTTYYWKIVAKDALGAEKASPVWVFTTKPNSPPYTPSQPTPPDGSTGQSVSVPLHWFNGDPDGQICTYDVYLGTQNPPPLVTPPYPPRQFNTQYWWKVVARDPFGLESGGPVWTFTTGAFLNHPPTVGWRPTPYENGQAFPITSLSWWSSDPDDQPTVDDVYFGTTEPLPLIATDVAGFFRTFALADTLEVGTRYYWRIVSSDGELETTGPTWSFTVVNVGATGDVDNNGQETMADVNCAMNIFFHSACRYDPEGCCGGIDSWVRADVNCDDQVTPRDARCIHKHILDGTCAYCEGTATAPPLAPSVITDAVWMEYDTLFVRLAVKNVPALESFGLFIYVDPYYPYYNDPPSRLMRVKNLGGAEGFYTKVDGTNPSVTVGGYFFDAVDASSPVTLIEAVFFAKTVNSVHVGGFVDDLSGAPDLITLGNEVPVLCSSFRAAPVTGGVQINWELRSDEAMKGFTLYRHDGAGSPARAVFTAPVQSTHGSYLDRTVEPGRTYEYELAVETADGDVFRSPLATATTAPLRLALHQNYPNPFNPRTTIRYDIPDRGAAVRVRLWILDVTGRIVRTLVDEDQKTGSREAVWNGSDNRGQAVSSGVYFYVLDAGGERRTRKLVLLK